MSKSFALTSPVFGPAISVRYRTAKGTFSPRVQQVSGRTSRRTAGRGKLIARTWAGLQHNSYVAYFLAGALIALLVSYILLINGSAAKGYEMRKIQNRIQEQSDIQHSLEIKTAELSSLGAIDQAAESAKLVSIKTEEFLAPTTVTAFKSSK